MRPYIVFVLLLALAGVFVVLQVTRKTEPYGIGGQGVAASATDAGMARTADAGAPRKGEAGVLSDARPDRKPPDAKVKPDAKPKPLLQRPLRVVSLGWELIAPGVVANDGASPGKASLFAKELLPLELAAHDSVGEVESALARGGADKQGADVALLPLPALVASHERLSALKLEIFFVVGWSRGSLGLLAAPSARFKVPRRGKTVTMLGIRGAPETFFARYLLELAGISAAKIKLLEPGAKKTAAAPYAAAERPLPKTFPVDGRTFVATTADAARLVPMVAVAPRGFVQSKRTALVAWARVWLEGTRLMQQDVPGTARRVAKLADSPKALDLLQGLGQLEPASLMDNARLAGLSGRPALTLADLFRLTWRVLRSSGALSSPMPEAAPLSATTLGSLVRTYPALVEAMPAGVVPAPAKPQADGDKAARADFSPLLVHPLPGKTLDRAAAALTMAQLAGIFPRAQLKLEVRGNKAEAQKVVETVRSRYDIAAPNRLKSGTSRRGPSAQIRIAIRR